MCIYTYYFGLVYVKWKIIIIRISHSKYLSKFSCVILPRRSRELNIELNTYWLISEIKTDKAKTFCRPTPTYQEARTIKPYLPELACFYFDHKMLINDRNPRWDKNRNTSASSINKSSTSRSLRPVISTSSAFPQQWTLVLSFLKRNLCRINN